MTASIPRLQSALINFITFAKFLTFLSRFILILEYIGVTWGGQGKGVKCPQNMFST